MADELRIRSATDQDVALIFRFIRELAEYEHLAHEVFATEESIRETIFGAHRFAEVLIADVDGDPVGFALYFHNFSTFAGRPGIYLEDFYVRREFRGRGYGKALLARLASIAQERKCIRLEWSVLNWNEPAIRFYRSLGARPVDHSTLYRLTGDPLDSLARNEKS